MSSYASRYSQRATTGGIDPRTKSPTVGRPGNVGGHTTTHLDPPLPKATRGSWSVPVGQRRTSTPSSLAVRGSSTRGAPSRQGANQNSEMLVSAVSQKLRGFQELRHLMQNLADRHKKEETELQTLMKKLLVVRGPHAQSGQSPKSSPPPTAMHSGATADELQQAIDARDKAIAMLSLFREEGNTVMRRMHDSLRHAHEQHETLMSKVEKLTIENARLRFVVREVRYFVEEADEETADGVPTSTADARKGAAAKETIAKLDELLMEADAVIISLRAQNEELLRQNESLRLRERRGQQQQPHHHSAHHQDANSDAASEPNSDVLNIDLAKADDESIAAFVEGLKQQLRTEKRQRLEAEELSHKLLIEHQKNVLLLEQRLMQRNMVGTPRSGTPRKPFSNSKASSVGQSMPATALDAHAASSSSSVSVGPKHCVGSAGSVHEQQRLDEEVELLLADSPNAGAEVSYAHHEDDDGDRDALLVPDLQEPASDEHEQHIAELRTIEAQLKEVVASLEES